MSNPFESKLLNFIISYFTQMILQYLVQIGSWFIKKCNILLAAFTMKKVSLNLRKSGFHVIYPQSELDCLDIKLESGWLTYRSTYVYLGAIFSDDCAVSTDVDLYVLQREKSIYIKLANFMRNNPASPITVKRKKMSFCLNDSLLYGCEEL